MNEICIVCDKPILGDSKLLEANVIQHISCTKVNLFFFKTKREKRMF